jgi:hypothetical protein
MAESLPSTGQVHTRIALADWNGDGQLGVLQGFGYLLNLDKGVLIIRTVPSCEEG